MACLHGKLPRAQKQQPMIESDLFRDMKAGIAGINRNHELSGFGCFLDFAFENCNRVVLWIEETRTSLARKAFNHCRTVHRYKQYLSANTVLITGLFSWECASYLRHSISFGQDMLAVRDPTTGEAFGKPREHLRASKESL